MFTKILVALDLEKPEMSAKLCRIADDLAKAADAEVKLVSVIPDYGMTMVATYFPEDAQQGLKQEMKAKMAAYVESFSSNRVSAKISMGKRTQKILKQIELTSPDLVIIGTRRKKSHGGSRLLGACSQSVTDRAGCNVLVVR